MFYSSLVFRILMIYRLHLQYQSLTGRSESLEMPSRTAPTSSMFDSLATTIPKAFDQAQTSTANHQKNFVALHKLHSDAAKHTESVDNGSSIKLTGERAYEDGFVEMVSRVLSVKKGASQA